MKKRMLQTLMATLALVLCAGTAMAQGNNKDVWHQQWNKHVVGKTIAFIPVALGLPLTDIWNQQLKEEAKQAGMKYIVRDPTFNAQREVQMINALIPKHPDVMIVHNPNAQILSNVIKKAIKAGIYVIQINMASKTPSAAFVGVNPDRLGRMMGTAITKACSASGARSNKVALMLGEPTSAYTIGIYQGAMSVFKKHSNIDIVSKQAANWLSKKAHDKSSTVLRAHPDLCAYMGFWIGQDVGIAQAIKQAGLVGKVKLFTTGGGEPPACKYVKQGLIYETFNYHATQQAAKMMALAEFLLQSGQPPGSMSATIFTPITAYTAKNIKLSDCTQVVKKK